MEADVLVVGALHLDVIVDAPHLPALDETVVGSAVAYRFGGKGGNQAVAAARMGARVSMAGRVGRDRFAEQILGALDAAGIDRTQVREGDGASGMSVAIVDRNGDYGAVIVSGENRAVDGQDISFPKDLRVLLLQNEIPEAVNLSVASRVARDVVVVLNAAPARTVAPELLSRADVVVVNRVEAQALAVAISDAPGALPPKTVITTLGPDGLILAERQGAPEHLPGHPVPVISTHGAGDAFVGALAARLARGDDIRAAARFAQAAAALHVSTPVDRRARITEEDVRRQAEGS